MERGGAGFPAPTLAFTLASPGVCKTNSCPEVCPCTKRRDACDALGAWHPGRGSSQYFTVCAGDAGVSGEAKSPAETGFIPA